MKLSEAMARADELRPNMLSDEQKAVWLWSLDGQIAEMMHLPHRPLPWPEENPELLMPVPHDEIYQLYLICKIDYYNQEMGLYANDVAIYNAALEEAQAWWRRHNRPREKKHWKTL